MRPSRLLSLATATAIAASIAVLGLADTGCGTTTCEFTATCASATSSSGDGGTPMVEPPPGCDPKADAKDSLKCVSNDYAMFVDATNGNDENPGTQQLPKKTIKNAIEKANGRPRIYICEGTYDERLSMTSATSLIGGFACGSWVPNQPSKAKLFPTTPGLVVHITGLQSEIAISDLEIRALPGVNPSDSSIGVFVQGTGNGAIAVFRRVVVSAGNGARGVDGTTSPASTSPDDPKGNIAKLSTEGGAGGAAKKCSCSNGTYSEGGKGGDVIGDTDGKNGAVERKPPVPDGYDGKGSTAAECNSASFKAGNAGSNGADGANGESPSALGTITPAGWTPGAGGSGKDGSPGQGGGGGGGRSTNPIPQGGGGGGCGGCGGGFGGGGTGGGSSIALLLVDVGARVEASTLTASDAGDAGNGASGTTGKPGGGGGVHPGGGGCGGGSGGPGGKGGAGAGGAGGVATGVLWKGKEPVVDDATKAATTFGKPGIKGTGAAGNDGPAGVALPVVGL